MPAVDVIIGLGPEACAAHYSGVIRRLYVSSVDGRRVLLPAAALRRVVTRDGVHGVFRLTYGRDGKLESLRRIGDRPPARRR